MDKLSRINIFKGINITIFCMSKLKKNQYINIKINIKRKPMYNYFLLIIY